MITADVSGASAQAAGILHIGHCRGPKENKSVNPRSSLNRHFWQLGARRPLPARVRPSQESVLYVPTVDPYTQFT